MGNELDDTKAGGDDGNGLAWGGYIWIPGRNRKGLIRSEEILGG